MKRLVFVGIISSFFIGCASKTLSTCEINKQSCIANCKLNYLNDNLKKKLCITECYTKFTACKLKEEAKKITH